MADQVTPQTMEILDPVGELAAGRFKEVPRLRDLRGARIGVLDTRWRSFTQYVGVLIPRLRDEFELQDVVIRTGITGEPTEARALADLSRTDAVLNGLCN